MQFVEPYSQPFYGIDDIVDHVLEIRNNIDYIIKKIKIRDNEESYFAVDDVANLKEIAVKVKKSRAARIDIFGMGSIFGEPAWDIIIEIFISQISKINLSVTNACIGANIPISTGLRWINILQDKNIAERFGDRNDKRRDFIRLTEGGFCKTKKCLLFV